MRFLSNEIRSNSHPPHELCACTFHKINEYLLAVLHCHKLYDSKTRPRHFLGTFLIHSNLPHVSWYCRLNCRLTGEVRFGNDLQANARGPSESGNYEEENRALGVVLRFERQTSDCISRKLRPHTNVIGCYSQVRRILPSKTMKNVVFRDIKSLFVPAPHRKHVTYLLQSPTR
jgi:hypothetical protein